MVRRFFRDSALYVIPTALNSGMALFLFPLYAHHFSRSEYGVLDLITITEVLVSLTVGFQLWQGLGRHVSGMRDKGLVSAYASTALVFTVVCYVIFGLAAQLAAVPLADVLFGTRRDVGVLRVGIAWWCIAGVLVLAQSQLRWQLRAGCVAVAGVINVAFTGILSVVLILPAHLGVTGAVLGQLSGSVASLVFILASTFTVFKVRFDRDRCAEMLRYSLPLVPAGVAVFLNLYADRLVIRNVGSVAEVGVYAVGYRIASAAYFLIAGTQGAITPLVLAHKDDPSTPKDLARIFRLFMVCALALFLFLSIMAPPMVRIFAAAPFQHAVVVVPWLVAAVLLSSLYMFAPGMMITKKTSVVAWLTLAAGLGNLGLALLLVPSLGILGAGIATSVTSLGWFAGMMWFSQKDYPAPHAWAHIVVGCAVALVIVTAAALTLPSGRIHALDFSVIIVRMALVLGGVALVTAVLLERDEWRTVWRGMKRVRHRAAIGNLQVFRRLAAPLGPDESE
jgi:O-antigen/teichoic acid export membrane protein